MSREERARNGSDVAIVGGGIVGLAIADELARRGASVVVLDPRPGGEASWAAAGMLAVEYEFAEDTPLAALALESLRRWPAFAERFADTPWAASVRPRASGTLVPAFSETELATLRTRYAKPRGRIEWLDAKAAREKEPSIVNAVGAAWLRDDTATNPRAVLLALLAKLGHRIVRTRVQRVVVEGGRARGLAVSSFARGPALSPFASSEPAKLASRDAEEIVLDPNGTIVLCNGAWASRVEIGPDHIPLPDVFPVRGQMLGFAHRLAHVVRWDSGYAVPRGDRIVIGSTVEPRAGFDKRVTPDAIETLTRDARCVIPSLGAHTHAWAGLRPATEDELPVLGALAPGLVLAGGHYRNGILLAPATAIAIADLVEGRRPAIAIDAFFPGRFASSWIRVNGERRKIEAGTTVRALLAEMSLERNGIAIARNDEVVRRSEWDTTRLQNEDRVEIIQAVGGG